MAFQLWTRAKTPSRYPLAVPHPVTPLVKVKSLLRYHWPDIGREGSTPQNGSIETLAAMT